MPQFDFVGQAYVAPNPMQDDQICVNWYPEASQSETSKTVKALLGTPGLLLSLTAGSGPIRGAWTLPGDTLAIVVSGNQAYMVSVASAATASAKATFTSTLLGTLATTSGPVCIRDNGVGGIAVIVDGPNGYVVNLAAGTCTQITDPAWMGADRVAYIDGWFVFNQPGKQNFYTSPLYWNGTSAMDPTYYALKDSSSDNLVTMFEDKRELWLIGERTTELWYDAGNPTFPFSRLQGITLQTGCAAKHSITRVGESILWLAKTERGQNEVVATEGYQVKAISTLAINHAIASYPVVSDAIGFAYQEDGHVFYVLTFPTANVTWVYDAITEMWHQRAAFSNGQFGRHLSNCFFQLADQRLVGDCQSGNIYQLSRQVFTDNGAPLVAWRRCPHIWDKSDRERLFHQKLQIEFTPGVGLQSGQGSNPQAVLRMSNDGGQTWGNEHWKGIGLAGQTKYRCIWRRLGYARDRVYDVKFSDPVNRDVVGASLVAE